ncbi:hypothetical protein, partial [Arenimonas composti]|uniref:hypothetical protein n=1 Tax=Arenimonas composti TaxID=370776 RepID=UPI001B80756F
RRGLTQALGRIHAVMHAQSFRINSQDPEVSCSFISPACPDILERRAWHPEEPRTDQSFWVQH